MSHLNSLNPENKQKARGKVYLIPVPIAADQLHTVPQSVKEVCSSLHFFYVENTRTARRYLKAIDPDVAIDMLQFEEVSNRHKPDLTIFKQWLEQGHSVGIMSEAGCPGVADPGSDLVAKAQEWNYKVIPLVGPSSILLALMGSGFNGQGFRFAGYLPVKEPMRSKAIKDLETLSAQNNETQIFIETPYRNNQLLQEIIKHCKANTRLCIAADLTSDNEFLKTLPLASWKQKSPELHKRPVIFLLMAGNLQDVEKRQNQTVPPRRLDINT